MADDGQSTRQKNPYESANPISGLTFWWTLPLFSKAKQKEVFELEDLYLTLSEDQACVLGDRLEKHWNAEIQRAEKNGKSPRLLRALLLTFWREFLYTGVLALFNDPVMRILQPILLGRLLLYFRSGPPRENAAAEVGLFEAWLLACGMLGVTACTIFLLNHYGINCFHNGMKMKVSACALIFRKAVRLSRTALGETATGQIVNLLANDVSRFDMVAYFLHMMWVSPTICLIVSILVVYELGPSGLFGIAVVLIVCPLQSWTGSLTSRYRRQTAFRTDKRVRLMDEIISGIQAIKLYAWEKPFGKLISKCRSEELSWVRKSSYIRGIYMTFNMFTTRMALFATLLAYALSGNHLAAEHVFVVSSYFSVLAWTMSGVFVRGVAELAETWVSTKRIQTFLLRGEFEGRPGAIAHTENSKVSFNHNSISEDKEIVKSSSTVKNLANATVNGVGKYTQKVEETEFCNGVKNEEVADITHLNGNSLTLDYEPGTLIVEDAVASWVIGAEPTINKMTFRVETGSLVAVIGAVGSGKSSLIQALLGELPLTSGKALVAARAVSYSSQEPWIFSGSLRENILFGKPFERRRYNQVLKACCLLPDIKRMANGDQTLVGERGGSLSGGQKARVTLARAAYRSDVDAYLLDEPLSALDVNVARHVFEDCIEGLLRGTTRVLVTHQLHLLRRADLIVLVNNGTVAAMGSYDQLMSSAEGFTKLLESGEDQDDGPVNSLLRQISSSSQQSLQAAKEEEVQESDNDPPSINVEQSKQGTVSKSVYTQYWKLGASPLLLIFLFFLFVLAQLSASGADYWVAYWTTVEQKRYSNNYNQSQTTNTSTEPLQGTEMNQNEELMSLEWCVIIYSIILIVLFVSAITRSLLHYVVSISSSQHLHDKMFKSLVAAPMFFFSWNPAGRVLNRFSRDLGCVDELLPKAILDTAQFMMMMIGAVIVTAIVNPIFLLPVFFLSFIFHFVRKNYLLTSRRIKRLEGAARSPVFSLLADVLQDLPTVRALNAEEMLKLRVEGYQDTHSSAWFMLISASTAFGFALDLMCLVFISVVTCAFLTFTSEDKGAESNVGLAITQAMMLTGMLQWGVRQSAEVENHMTAVERCLEYTTLEEEPQPKKAEIVPKDWPSIGKINFNKTCLRYIPDQPFVLKDLTLIIEPTFKVGIVGRTGAGKSSLINALFRMAPLEGQVVIDSLDTGKISLSDLRTKISIIPQDPVLFSGTLRYNLDPFEEFPDDQLWKSLEDVELKDAVVEQSGLESPVSAGGTNWSVGQRQLLCLARTILRRNKVLVLDEATANVDPQTDALIQATIRRQFKDCTVLTVAHRLHTIMDSDRVIVMSDGVLAEFGPPHELLQTEGSLFRRMVEDTGRATAATLFKVAEEAYRKSSD